MYVCLKESNAILGVCRYSTEKVLSKSYFDVTCSVGDAAWCPRYRPFIFSHGHRGRCWSSLEWSAVFWKKVLQKSRGIIKWWQRLMLTCIPRVLCSNVWT